MNKKNPSPSTEPQDAFLKRWSRRKVEAAQTTDAPAKIDETDEAAEELPDHAGEPDQDAAIPEDLPDIETLNKDSDFTPFLREGVPEALKRQALRILWRSDPIFANLDGLNDYDDDFSIIGNLAEKISTLYEPGRGYLKSSEIESANDLETESLPEAPDGSDGDGESDPAEPEQIAEDIGSDPADHEREASPAADPDRHQE